MFVNTFESYDPGITQIPIEFRHPLADLRLVRFLLSVPPVPWCVKKRILRSAMRGILPEAIRLRPKAALAGDPLLEYMRRRESHWVDSFTPTLQLAEYVDRDAIPPLARENRTDRLWMNMKPFGLDCWLRSSDIAGSGASARKSSVAYAAVLDH